MRNNANARAAAGTPKGVPLLNLLWRLGSCREQLAEVFVELTDRIRISTE